MDYETITLDLDGPVATLTLNRPDVLNAISPKLVGELGQAVTQVEDQPGVKALVIRGAGRAFCAGADLKFMGQAFDDYPLLAGWLKDINEVLFRLEELPMPVIAVVHGFALGGLYGARA